jgi:hypothetical protein
MRHVLHVLAIALAVGSAGCEETQTCTLIACFHELRIRITSPTWTPGTYDITLQLEDARAHCQVVLPLLLDEQVDVDAGDASGMLGDCGEPIDGRSLATLDVERDLSITIGQQPEAVQVTLERDGALLLDDEFEPDYESYYPNGPNCGECTAGTLSIAIP